MVVRPEKKEIVKEIRDKLKKANAVVLTDFRGLDVHSLAELRTKLHEEEIEYKVFKNTLMRIAAKKQGLDDLLEYIEGPTALALSNKDAVSVCKILVNFAKEHDELEIKGGLTEDGVVSVSEIKTLASIPSRDELIARFVGQVGAPVSNFVSVLARPAQGLILTLNAIASEK